MNRDTALKVFAVIFIVNIYSADCFSQPLSVIQKMKEEPVMDGLPFEPAWDGITARSLFMLLPVSGGAPTQKSEAKIGYTDKYLYVAGYLYDDEPDKIRAKSKKRDEIGGNNDFFGIALDTYNDNENALSFYTTPAGLRLDAQIFNDGQATYPMMPMQTDWNTLWDVKTKIDDRGWFVEMQIPLSSLRYNNSHDKVVMGMNFYRYISRLAEADIYPKTSNEWGFWSFTKPSQFEDVEITGIRSTNPLYFSPYLLGGVERNTSLNEKETAYNASTKWEANAGMDMKAGLSKSLTLDLTVNTDFAQVEADDQQINLTRFSLFFPEKRQFFLERSSIFDFKFGNEGQLFYSRRIGLAEDQIVPIWGGGRLTGRAGLWDIGIMSLQTGSLKDDKTGEELLPTINNSVARLRRKLPINSNSYAGGLFTSKVDIYGKYNLSYGVDGVFNIQGNDYLDIAIASTTESDLKKGTSFSDLSELYLQWERRTYKGLSFNLNLTKSGNSYNPALGFEYRKDFSRYEGMFSYGFIPGNKSKFLKQHQFTLDASSYTRNSDNVTETVEIKPYYTLSTKRDHNFGLGTTFSQENDIDSFSLSKDVYIPHGSYTSTDFWFFYQTPSVNLGYFNILLITGQYYDGWINSCRLVPSLTLGGSWIMDMTYEINDIQFKERNQHFLSHLFMFKVLYMFSTAISTSSFIQYNNQIDKVIWNFRFRFNPKEGNDLYLVYNDLLNTSRDEYVPALPASSQRTLLIKYTHTFRVR
jgi:Domain of unknown function (DUF5916)